MAASLQTKSEKLATGFVRFIMKHSMKSTPKEIFSIISNFFLKGSPFLILWNGRYPSVHLLDITKGIRHELSILNLKTKEDCSHLFQVPIKHAGHCMISNIDLPSWVTDINHNHIFEGIKDSKLYTKCSMIFRFGGRNHSWQSQNLSQLIIYPTNNEFKTGYYVDLPALNECMSSASYIYNIQNTERIYQFGGCDNDWDRMKDIKYMDLNAGFNEWYTMKSRMEKAKCFPSLCNYKDGIFVIGGYDGQFNKDLEFIDIKKDEIMKCKDMITV